MSKKILIGSIFVLILFLLMPSIPAIHIGTIENNIKQEINKVKQIDLLEFKKPDKFPLLYYFVMALIEFRWNLSFKLFLYSVKPGEEIPGTIEIVHPLIFIYTIILLFRTLLLEWGFFWISTFLGWGWH